MEPPAMKPPTSGGGGGGSCGKLNRSMDVETMDMVVKFASLLSTKSTSETASGQANTIRSPGLFSLYSEAVADDEVVLLLPSVDLTDLSQEHLPEVGKHASGSSDKIDNGRNGDVPAMRASVLTGATDVSVNVEQKAKNMVKQTSWTKSTLSFASTTVSSNLSESFTSLLNSRIKAWTLLLLRHSLTTGDSESRKRLLGMLKASVKVTSTETYYKTLQLPESAAGQERDSDVILPLLLESRMKVEIEGRPESVVILAPGTISADTCDPAGGLKKVTVRVDSTALIKELSNHARIVVFKAVASVTSIAVPSTDKKPQSSQVSRASTIAEKEEKITADTGENSTTLGRTSSSLAGFRSMLNISPHAADRSPGLQKARSSALRLTSVLQGKDQSTSPSTLGPRKTRSVHWDSPAALPKINPAELPDVKKQRMIQSQAKLASFKSFGRPHGGDGGPITLNATFGEYGGRQQTWDRHGRLAHHPTPMQANVGRSMLMRDIDSSSSAAVKNASFDLRKFKTRSNPASQSLRTLPRTATALENWLLKKSTA